MVDRAGTASLLLFAWLLTLVDSSAACRAYAAYGGVHIASSLLWLWNIEGVQPDRRDTLGALICLPGRGHSVRSAIGFLTSAAVAPQAA